VGADAGRRAAAPRFDHPHGVAVDTRGSIYVADALNNTIRKINPLRVVSTIAGSASSSGTADGTGADARFNHPQSVALDHAGNFLVADSQNHTIRRITSAEVVSTLAGLAGSSGTNDGPGTRARFSAPSSIAIDNDNNIYVADSANHTIRKVTSEGLVTTLAGSAGISDHQDGIGNVARFSYPASVAIDREGSLFVADNSKTIRKLTPQGMNWVVTTIAGSVGESGSNDGTNNTARFADPRSVTVDLMGNVFVVDYDNYTIRKITRLGTNWVVTTVAGQTGQSMAAKRDV